MRKSSEPLPFFAPDSNVKSHSIPADRGNWSRLRSLLGSWDNRLGLKYECLITSSRVDQGTKRAPYNSHYVFITVRESDNVNHRPGTLGAYCCRMWCVAISIIDAEPGSGRKSVFRYQFGKALGLQADSKSYKTLEDAARAIEIACYRE